jgi:hypothetical protein
MSQNNLLQVVTMDDLLYLLGNGKNKIIVLTLVLPKSDESIKRKIKKFIKKKSEIYNNVLFLYYVVRNEDFEKISLITKNKMEYPKMCHIYNKTELLLEVSSIDNIEILESSFQKVDGHYKKFKYEEHIEKEEQKTIHEEEEQNIKNPIADKKKHAEKLELLKKYADDYNVDFFKDCQKRKKEEEKCEKHKKK